MKQLMILALLLMMAVFASALTVEGNSSLNMCQCETVTSVYQVCGNAGTYDISITGATSEWFNFAPNTINLSNNECKDVFVFVTPSCYATSGTFSNELKILGAESVTKRILVNVEQCHTFDYVVTPLSNSSKPCDPNYLNIYVKNTGKFSDEFVLLQKGLPDDWVTYNQDYFVLKAGEEINTTLKIQTPCSTLSGNYTFELELANTRTNANQTKNLTQEIVSFNPISYSIPNSIDKCSEEINDYNILIRNDSSMEDELTLSVNNNLVSLSGTKFLIAPNETKTVNLIVNSSEPIDTNFVFSLSSKNYEKTFEKVVILNQEDCYNIAIGRATDQNTFCMGNNTQSYVVSNNGTKNVDVFVSMEGIEIDAQKVSVNAGETEEVSFVFNATKDNYLLKAIAGTDYSGANISHNVLFENCYGTELIVTGLELCANSVVTREITLKNNGTKNQVFTLNTSAEFITLPSQVSVDANSEKKITLDITVPAEVESSYLVTAKSENAQIDRTMAAVLLPNDVCNGFEMIKSSSTLDVNCCSGEIVEVLLKNTGVFAQDLTIKKIAPPWVSFSQQELNLDVGEEKIVYVYFSPPAGTNGNVMAQISVENLTGVSKTFDFNLNVFGGNCGIELEADLNIDNEITLTKIFTRKEIDVEFVVKNDSNIGFSIYDIIVEEFPTSEVEFIEGIFLEPNASTKARLTVSFLENYEPQDKEVTIKIITSVGDIERKQLIKFSDQNNALVFDEVAITSFFTQFVAPAAGIILLIVLSVIIVLIANRPAESKIKKK